MQQITHLVSEALCLASSHGLDLNSITCNDAPTNFGPLRSFGCEFGMNMNDVKDSFSFEALDHPFSLFKC